MATPKLAMFGFIVEDMARSLAFYRKLGMEFPEGSDEREGFVIPIGGGLQMFWSTVFAAKNDPKWTPPSGGYGMLIEFFVEGREAVDALYESLVADGHPGRKPPFVADFGAYMALVEDPDGNTVLITAG